MCHDPLANDVLLVIAIAQAATIWAATTGSVANDPQGRQCGLERQGDVDSGFVSAGALAKVVRGRLATELVVGAGVAWSVKLFQSTANRRYAVQTVSWARELTGPLGPGVLRGRFAWAAEATPLFAQTAPSPLYGVGIAPVVWRWNFEPRPGWSAFGELAMGGLWTSAPIPEKTARANFTAHWGGGVRLHASNRHALILAYRFQHISNGNNLGSNPGVNSHVVLAGLSLTRYRS